MANMLKTAERTLQRPNKRNAGRDGLQEIDAAGGQGGKRP